MKRMFAALVVTASLAAGAMAQEGTTATAPKKQGRVETRKDNQQDRIAKGVESGALTSKETAKLEAKEARLNREIKKDRQDGGGMTAKERNKIEKKQDKLSREIAKDKHDKQHAKH